MAEQTDLLLEQLNRFTRRSHTLEEVYLFDLVLCDNEIDRDGDCFSEAALQTLQKRFVGVTGIFDHNPKADGQTARIFQTALVRDETRKTKTGRDYWMLKANAYMVRTEKNADLIREIDGGIKKEVSVSCAVERRVCSICGANRLQKACAHTQGRSYGGTLCYRVLDGVTDVYEWSFVAVPAQRRAGVVKTFGETGEDASALSRALEAANQTIDTLTEVLRRDVIRLCYGSGDQLCAKALADATLHMDTEELLGLQKTLQLAPFGKATGTAQLIASDNKQRVNLQAFRLDAGEKEVRA